MIPRRRVLAGRFACVNHIDPLRYPSEVVAHVQRDIVVIGVSSYSACNQGIGPVGAVLDASCRFIKR